jgi:hypothetical protein
VPLLLQIFFWGALTACLLFLATSNQCKAVLKKEWRKIGLLTLLAFVWRMPLDGRFFQGLEYEDSYVYTVSGRYLGAGSLPGDHLNSRYLTTVCAVGNWNSCKVSDTFSGHFVGYPFMIALISRLLGFSPMIASYLSLSASLITVVLIFLVGELIDPGGSIGLAGSLVFCLTPVFAVQGVGTYAEPVSNALVVMCLLLGICFMSSNDGQSSPGSIINWVALTLTALFAVVVKRENVLLIPIMVVASIAVEASKRDIVTRIKWSRYLMAVASIFLCVGFTFRELRLVRIIESETAEFRTFPFNPAIFKAVFPLFAKSYLSLSWYLGIGILVLLGSIGSMYYKRRGVFPFSLFVAYLILYSSHVRSYYQLQTGYVSEFDTIRYSMNVAGILSIIAGIGISFVMMLVAQSRVQPLIRKYLVPILCFLIGSYAVSSWMLTRRLKEDMINNEVVVRIQPAQAALQLVSQLGVANVFVITLEPLVVQMLARAPVKVIDFRYLNEDLVDELSRESPNLELLYVEQVAYASAVNRERYRKAFACVDSMHKDSLYRGKTFTIYRIALPITGAGLVP